MGLDVRVYKNIELLPSIDEDNDEWDFTAFVIDDYWLHKIKNLTNRGHYKGETSYRGISYAYSTHTKFRARLLDLIGRQDLLTTFGDINWELVVENDDIPFFDFIDFADNEGCLDWEISSKIYDDFAKYNDEAKKRLDEYMYSKYVTWMETFENAKDNKGVIVFS
jgi:hypothetical protein